MADGGVHHALPDSADDDDHHHDAPPQDGEHHHHDFSVMDEGQWMKSAEYNTVTPAWVPLFDMFVERFADTLREGREPRLLPKFGHAPPDERGFGWLLVCQTALPVRGPSLAV